MSSSGGDGGFSIICPSCGAEQDPAAHVCTTCGFVLLRPGFGAGEGEELSAGIDQPPAAPPRPGQLRDSHRSAFAALFLVCGLAAAGALAVVARDTPCHSDGRDATLWLIVAGALFFTLAAGLGFGGARGCVVAVVVLLISPIALYAILDGFSSPCGVVGIQRPELLTTYDDAGGRVNVLGIGNGNPSTSNRDFRLLPWSSEWRGPALAWPQALGSAWFTSNSA
jgi:hypothetical protein